ncbi:MAG: sigma-70 family RNA polymerase sigma factor, partial [Planctomycetes bacterium]|nr:sigma-70 family RNA polymerase sigma factor [Planctomycetota bacterium]
MATANMTTASDGDLLAAFVSHQRHEAFEEIVRRHGALVMGVCRSVLGGGPDAEDAAQAVFLAMIRKAASLRQHPTLAGWLHRVAWYAAARERKSIKARMRHEREAANMKSETGQTRDENIPLDLLHEGLARLPEKYRLPIILHHIEGRSQEEVASLLVQNVRTIASRLNRGRQMLQDRLIKTGAVVSVAGLAVAMAGQASAGVSAAFVASATKMAALSLTAKAAAAGAASAKVLALSKGALQMVFIAKMKVAALLTAAVCLVGATAAGTYMAAAGPGARTALPPPKPPPQTEIQNPPVSPAAPTDQVTTIEITDKVLVKDVSRFGINLSADKFYGGAAMIKKRAQDNFEGTLYRQCHFGPMDANGVGSWFSLSPDWQKILLDGGTYTVLSGPSKQTSGKIKAMTKKTIGDKEWQYFELDKEIQPLPYPKMGGILVENLQRIRDGQMPDATPLTSKGNEIVIGDTPP